MPNIVIGSSYLSEQIAIVTLAFDAQGNSSETPVDLTGRGLTGNFYDVGSISAGRPWGPSYGFPLYVDYPLSSWGSWRTQPLATITNESGGGINVIDAASGLITFQLTAGQTCNFGRYSAAPGSRKRQVQLRIADTTTSDNPGQLYEQVLWAYP
jgi:hypothetical protein